MITFLAKKKISIKFGKLVFGVSLVIDDNAQVHVLYITAIEFFVDRRDWAGWYCDVCLP